MKQILSVSDFIEIVNQTLEYAYTNIQIEGEVSSFKINQGKYVFFDLKDETGSINCFMTVWQLRIPIEDGMKILVSGSPKLTSWGKFSLSVSQIAPSGEGAIKKSFELLKAKLEAEGLFAPQRKRLLPDIPKHVAVISSIQAAGYADFIKIINDRWGGMKVDVANVQVQGIDAPDQIIGAINYFNQREDLPEVIVLIRGGGSADDLSVFNDEPLVRTLAASRIPTLVGVGHETDESLCDLVADVRAATPSNAAQILVPDRKEMINLINFQFKSIIPKINSIIDSYQSAIQDRLQYSVTAIEQRISKELLVIGNIRNVIDQLNPDRVLARGYAIIRGKPEIGKLIELEMIDKIMKAEVKNVSQK